MSAQSNSRKRHFSSVAGDLSGQNALVVPRCFRWHMRVDHNRKIPCYVCRGVVVPRRCEKCHGFLRFSGPWCRLLCVSESHHLRGYVIQQRTEEECHQIYEFLQRHLEVREIILLIIDFDHGGSMQKRVEWAAEVGRHFIYSSGDSEAAM